MRWKRNGVFALSVAAWSPVRDIGRSAWNTTMNRRSRKHVRGILIGAAPAIFARSESSAAMREARPVANTQSETIVNRLVKLLSYLQEHDAPRRWDGYLLNGEPNWSRIVVSGLSQGAGMAAYIAKRKAVARAVLFSSPWDFMGASRQLAPWISEPSATPPDRLAGLRRSLPARAGRIRLGHKISVTAAGFCDACNAQYHRLHLHRARRLLG